MEPEINSTSTRILRKLEKLSCQFLARCASDNVWNWGRKRRRRKWYFFSSSSYFMCSKQEQYCGCNQCQGRHFLITCLSFLHRERGALSFTNIEDFIITEWILCVRQRFYNYKMSIMCSSKRPGGMYQRYHSGAFSCFTFLIWIFNTKYFF